MSSDLAVRSGSTLTEKIQYAQALAQSDLLPAAYRQRPANVLLAIEMGESLGLVPIQAINSIHVIEGKPSASADLVAALIRRAGHKLRLEVDVQNLVAVATLIRKDDPDFPFVARWDMERAKKAGLAGKGTWTKDPAQMLRNRTVTEVARMGASDVLHGVIYTPEELGVETDAEGNPVVPQLEPPEPPARPAVDVGPPPLAKAKARVWNLSKLANPQYTPDERTLWIETELKAKGSSIADADTAMWNSLGDALDGLAAQVVDADLAADETSTEASE